MKGAKATLLFSACNKWPVSRERVSKTVELSKFMSHFQVVVVDFDGGWRLFNALVHHVGFFKTDGQIERLAGF